MPPKRPLIQTLPPELFPLIASHLTLYTVPTTLLSLALANHELYDLTYNLLYSCLVLRNEKDALSIIHKILADPLLGRLVRELYVQSELSVSIIDNEDDNDTFDTVTGLQKLIRSGYLPNMHTFILHLLNECRDSEKEAWFNAMGYGHLEADFWEDLRNKCPRVRKIVITGIGDDDDDPWINNSGIYELRGMQELTHLGLSFAQNRHATIDGPDRLLANIHNLTSSLQTIILSCNSSFPSAAPILSLQFLHLQSLTLNQFRVPDTMEAMKFWERHPSINKLKLTDTFDSSHWFSENVTADLLPNLEHLEASFHDVRALLPILHHLKSLSVQQSVNAQVPYLLRFLIPQGLSNLASLEIDQVWSTHRETLQKYEGSSWYETPDGKFCVEKRLKKSAKSFRDGYIHSIVKGAPSIEELCLHGIRTHPLNMIKVAPELAEFTKLKRFYFRGVNDAERAYRNAEDQKAFYDSSHAFAEKCKALERVTDISSWPYMAANIRRNDAGEVEDVVPKEGYGTIIGSEDMAFPSNPNPFVSPG